MNRVPQLAPPISAVPPLLDLSLRDSAADRELMIGSRIWYCADVRLEDGAARIVPGSFGRYGFRGLRCSIYLDGNAGQPLWVMPTDVLVRQWADDAAPVDGMRLAWTRPQPQLPTAAAVLAGWLGALALLAMAAALVWLVLRAWSTWMVRP